MKNNYVTKVSLLVFTFLCSVLSWGQASIATLGTPVVENFAGYLGTSTLPTNWTVTVTGAFAGSSQTSGTTGGWYGNNNMSYLGSGSASNGNATWKLRNNTGSTITSFDISFVARMWRSQTNSPTVSLTYSTNSTGTVPAAGALTSILTFNDATASIATGTTLTQTVSSLSVANGDYIYIRFLHPGGSTSDNLGWDDVSITCNGGCTSAAISAQPSTTVQNLCQSGSATALSVTATGSTLTYQWYSNTTATNSGGTLIASATSASYTPSTAAVGTLYYYCVATASCGLPVTSNVSGAVNVTSLPSAPSGTINVSANPSCGAATLSYSAPSANIYWQTTAVATSTGSPTTSNYTSSATAGSQTVYVRQLNGTCWSPATSVTFTVVAPVSISVQPTNQNASVGNTATFTVTAANATSYQWQVNAGSGFVNIGTNSNSYTTPATTLGMSGYLYQVIISGNAPCGTVTSSVATLNVTTGPCLSANFDSGNPAGWLIDGTVLGGQFCEGSQGLVFNGFGDNVITTAITNPQTLTFSKKRSSTADTWAFNIDVSTSSSGPWTNVATINTITTACQTETIDLSAYTSGTYFIRFMDNRPSGTAQRTIDDVKVFCGAACTPATITATPSSGPEGTEVTITASTGSLTGASVSFGAINATIVSNTGTQMVVVVPTGATTGTIKVTDAQPCNATTPFTLITKDNSSCEGTSSITDLIIYDIHDEKTGSGGFITLYNGTAATVNLTNYSIWRATDLVIAQIDYANLTGTIAPGALGILKVSGVTSCGPASTNGTIDGGFNENDDIQLRNADGSVIIDDVNTYTTAPGYYMVRNAGALSARTSYVASDWSTTPLIAGQCYPSAGLTLPIGGTSPIVTTHPTYSPSCGSTSAVLNTAGTEGFAGGNTLAYQWYFAAPGNATWTAVTNGGIYSGATTASLSLSNTTTVINFQYYCQIRENSATCYSASNAIKITDSGASTWNGSTWIGGTPTLTKAAIIDGTYVTATNGNFSCCSLTVNATRSLTISSGGYVEVENNITNNGTLDVLNNGSLVQINDSGVNTGNIRYNRTANIRRQDYVYWSSPVAGFNNTAISPTTPLGFQYKWLPTTAGVNNFGNWTYANETMVLGKGYIVRGPNAFSLTALANYTATFTGVPNNGVVTIPISRGTWNSGTYPTLVSTTLGTNEDDNWNLVGNPYPSAIHAIDFLTLNTNIAGFVNIWTHGTLPSNSISDPFYNDYAYNYTPGDYLTFNAVGPSTGPGAGSFNGRIAGGQGFFVSMLHTSAATTENLIFNNSLRNITHNNSQFYRTSNGNNTDDLERHRIWFDLVTPTGTSVRSLLGYVENATNDNDRLFDAFSNEKLSFNIFSLIDDEKMLIQGRKLPFDNKDKVNIGVAIPQDGLYKIALSSVDGLFSNANQSIYLEDKLLNIIYDLRAAPYSFMASKGTIKDRFVIRYTNRTVLGNETFETNNDVVVVSNQELSVVSTKEKIAKIIVFDVLGRKLFEAKDIKTNNFTLPINKRNAPLFIEIDLENGIKINKKTVY